MAAHTALARQLGVSEALLDALYRIDEFRHLFTERELVALRFAEIMTNLSGMNYRRTLMMVRSLKLPL